MQPIQIVSLARSLLELGLELSRLITRATKEKRVERKILLYLDVARASVQALGIERQQILTDARRCDIKDKKQVKALWERMYLYLHKDKIRPQLENAIGGLRGSRGDFERKAQGLRWRKRDKKAAIKTFLITLDDLESLLEGLVYDFLPGGSGLGVQTLIPIEELIKKIRDKQITDHEAAYEELGKLIHEALCDSSHEEWIHLGGKVETLIAELQLAFSINDKPVTD